METIVRIETTLDVYVKEVTALNRCIALNEKIIKESPIKLQETEGRLLRQKKLREVLNEKIDEIRRPK